MSEKERKIGVGFGVMVLRDNKVLLGKRHQDPGKADSELHGEGTWTMPGGKLHFGESFEQAAVRELKEETGLDANESSLKLISVANDAVADAQFVTIGFLCDTLSGEPMVMEPDEITEWQWFDIKNLPEPLFFPSRKVLENYLAGEVYQK